MLIKTKLDALSHVTPELRTAGRGVIEFMESAPEPSMGNLARFCQAMTEEYKKPVPPDPSVPYLRRTIAGYPAGVEVPIVVINAQHGARQPAIVHMHGGGFLFGAAADGVRFLQDMAVTIGCVVVSVDYRVAPAATWDMSVEDNYAALRWLYEHAEEVGADRDRIAVMGESAGGGHAALLAITARDRGEYAIAFQCLTYPMLDDRTGSSVRVPAHIGAIQWTEAANRLGWHCLLGQVPGTDTVPTAAVPARVEEVEGLPPAWIGVGSIDLFIHEDITYATRLLSAGIETELVVVPGAFHAFDLRAPSSSIVMSFHASRLNALRRGLG
ncbi:Acetyl esterase/lipase [Paraburkholderia sacchari]|uniref:alpha/beta hydrolase n=1 Tax=Paraburkholderia sacchari TaxID=159450 RepID=UPI0039A5F522